MRIVMFRKATSLVLVLVFLISLSGCATILKDKETQIKLDSEPQGAEVYLTKQRKFGSGRMARVGRTPTTITLEHKQSAELTFKKDGYEENNYTLRPELQGGWMLASFACFVFPAFFDLVSNNAMSIKEKEIKVTLDPVLSKQAEQVNTRK